MSVFEVLEQRNLMGYWVCLTLCGLTVEPKLEIDGDNLELLQGKKPH